MDKLLVYGGYPINGSVIISGAKNAALPILFATILTNETVVLHNVPRLHDVETTIRLLENLGAKIVWTAENSLTIDASRINNFEASYDLVKQMRASVLVLGPLMGRYQQAKVSLPGGCAIGVRPIDQHLKGLEKLGVIFDLKDGYIAGTTKLKRLFGNKVTMDLVTVTGTENLLMAAVLAEGITYLENAAIEPEVCDLANFLNVLGAKITGIGTPTLKIEGVEKLKGGTYTIMPDRIEAGTYLAAAAISKGKVRVEKVVPSDLTIVLEKFTEMGGEIVIDKDSISLDMKGKRPKAVNVTTKVYPGFPTDMQAQFLAINCVATGTGVIEETIFENRMMHVQELRRLGARIDLHGNIATVFGQECLSGAEVMATDLRASASLVLAGLVANGKTVVDRIYHVDRGYERLEEKLSQLGAKVERIKN